MSLAVPSLFLACVSRVAYRFPPSWSDGDRRIPGASGSGQCLRSREGLASVSGPGKADASAAYPGLIHIVSVRHIGCLLDFRIGSAAALADDRDRTYLVSSSGLGRQWEAKAGRGCGYN